MDGHRTTIRRRRRRLARAFSLVLASTVAVGILIFAPVRNTPKLKAADVALSQHGLGAETEIATEWLARLRTMSAQDVAAAYRESDRTMISSLEEHLPVSAGNLDGLPFAFRDALNRRALAIRTTLMKKRVRDDPDDRSAATSLAAYRAIAKALKPSKPKRQLTVLTADAPPLAAISVGDLDTATQVTWQIPGMGTYTTDMQLWSLAAQNLYDAQGAVGGRAVRAVVAWMDYLPPPPPPSIEAARGFFAEAGAPNLIRDVEGFRAARTDIADVDQNIVAHSYGTTVTANALASADLGIRSVVMLGSAGVETSIGKASALHAQHVYAAQGTRDAEAPLGRFSRSDPRSPAFGAVVFGCDGDSAENLKGVTGHAPILHSDWNDDPGSSLWTRIVDVVERIQRFAQHRASFGYLDTGTESLANTASATTPGATRALTHVRVPTNHKDRQRAF